MQMGGEEQMIVREILNSKSCIQLQELEYQKEKCVQVGDRN